MNGHQTILHELKFLKIWLILSSRAVIIQIHVWAFIMTSPTSLLTFSLICLTGRSISKVVDREIKLTIHDSTRTSENFIIHGTVTSGGLTYAFKVSSRSCQLNRAAFDVVM